MNCRKINDGFGGIRTRDHGITTPTDLPNWANSEDENVISQFRFRSCRKMFIIMISNVYVVQ